MAIPKILDGTAGPASESGVPSYNAVWNGSQWVPMQAGAAGTPAGGVQSVQGVPSGTPIPVSQPGLSGGILQSVTTLTNATTAYPVPATPLAGRVALFLLADPGNTVAVYIGSATVTPDAAVTGGILLLPGQSWPVGNIAAAVIVYAFSAGTGQKVRSFEVAG